MGRGGLEPPHLRTKSPAPYQFGYRPTSTTVVGHRGVEPRPGVYKTPVLTHTPVPNLVSLAATAGLEPAGPSRALLLSGQVLWPLSDVAVRLRGGRPGTRTPTTVSRLGRLATCCLTIRQAFRPFHMLWRRGRDSNPRTTCAVSCFRDRCLAARLPLRMFTGCPARTRTSNLLVQSQALSPLSYGAAWSPCLGSNQGLVVQSHA